MGRPGKVMVDYFPHVTNTGKTIAILESRWGNDGYAFWFKLLEMLGSTNGFCYNCNSASDWEYLLSRTHVSEEDATAILDKLAEVDAIDAGLWQEKLVWSDNFVAGVVHAFEKRISKLPQKPALRGVIQPLRVVSGAGNVPEDENDGFPGPETGEGEERKGEDREGTERDGTLPACPSMKREGVVRQADTVFLKPAEMERLILAYGAGGAKRLVEILDAYKTNHPGKCAQYRNDCKVMTAWVETRYLEERDKAAHPDRGSYAMTKLEQLAKEAAAHDPV